MTLVRRDKAADATIAMQIRGARSMLCWSQAELAERSGITPRTIADLECGRRMPRNETCLRIVAALAAAGVELFERNGRIGLTLAVPGKSSQPAGRRSSNARRLREIST